MNTQVYSLLFKFLQTYSATEFSAIDRNQPLIQKIESCMILNNQFFYIADLISLKILFTSAGSADIIGVNPELLSFYHFIQSTHPDDLIRHNLARSTIMNKAQKLFMLEKGEFLFSTDTRIKNLNGKYSNILNQMFLFYKSEPLKTVYMLKVHTNIDSFKKVNKDFHYYSGDDLTNFRFPDEKLLRVGNVFSKREFEIIKLVSIGLSTEQIAEKLFLSPYTINTHRVNILKKSKMNSMSELIHELLESGFM